MTVENVGIPTPAPLAQVMVGIAGRGVGVGWTKAHHAERRVATDRRAPLPPLSNLAIDRVGKVARRQCAMSSAAAGDFAYPTAALYRLKN